MEYKRPAPLGAWLEGHLAGIERDRDFVTVHCELRTAEGVANKGTAVFKVADRS